jgi:hypothetical protein
VTNLWIGRLISRFALTIIGASGEVEKEFSRGMRYPRAFVRRFEIIGPQSPPSETIEQGMGGNRT